MCVKIKAKTGAETVLCPVPPPFGCATGQLKLPSVARRGFRSPPRYAGEM
jgi:hypothetical protein